MTMKIVVLRNATTCIWVQIWQRCGEAQTFHLLGLR